MNSGSLPQVNDLLQRAQQGEHQAFEQLFARFWDMAYFFCRKLLDNEYDAEDATQEVFMMLHRRIKNSTGLFLVEKCIKWDATTVCRQYYQNRNKREETLAAVDFDELGESVAEDKEEFLPHVLLEKRELGDQLMALVDALPQKQREAVMLYHFSGFSQNEIARMTQSSVGSVQNRLFNAKKQMRERIEALADKGGINISAVVPVITQLLHRQMRELAKPEIGQVIWQRLDSRIINIAGENGKNKGKTSKTSSVGQNILIGAAATAACVCLVIGGVSLLGQKNSKAPADVHEQQADDVITALKKVNSRAEFAGFVSAYGFEQMRGATNQAGDSFVMYYKEFAGLNIAGGDGQTSLQDALVLAGYCQSGDDFRRAYEICKPGSQLPQDVEQWVKNNFR